MLIKDFKVGEEITGFYLVKAKNIKTSSANKPYIDFTLQDISGEVNAKLWDAKGDVENLYASGEIVKIQASVTQWQQSVQLKIIKIRTNSPEDEIDYSQFVPTAPIPADAMLNEILSFVESMDNYDIKILVKALIEDYREQLMFYPAAKSNHHAIKSGLLYHILRMLRSAKALGSVYHNINLDLVYAGVILHDIEKINEMNASEVGVVEDYTKEGQLLGHIIMGYNLSLLSMFGLVALSGVVVNDSLLLIDQSNNNRRNGLSLYDAIVAAATRRFRPILLTSLTTFFGLMPMILETSVQARFLIPMAISLGFGILFATGITLLLIPVLYLILEDIRKLFGLKDNMEEPH